MTKDERAIVKKQADLIDWVLYTCMHLCDPERRKLRDVQHELEKLALGAAQQPAGGEGGDAVWPFRWCTMSPCVGPAVGESGRCAEHQTAGGSEACSFCGHVKADHAPAGTLPDCSRCPGDNREHHFGFGRVRRG